MGFGGGGGGGAEEEWRVGDYPVGFIVIAVLLKNTETVCLAYSSAPPAMEHIGPYTFGRDEHTQQGCTYMQECAAELI